MSTVTLTRSGTVFDPTTDDGNSYIFTDGSEIAFGTPGMNFIGTALSLQRMIATQAASTAAA